MPRTALSVEELQRMKAKLAQEVIDDPEELLNWFGAWGSELIDEVLAARKLARLAARKVAGGPC